MYIRMIATGFMCLKIFPSPAGYGCSWFDKWAGLSSKSKVMVAAALISGRDYTNTNLYFSQSTIIKELIGMY
jgi:hypothetical protein